MIPVVRLKLELNIPTSAPITVVKEIIDTHYLFQIKQLKSCQNNQMQQCIT